MIILKILLTLAVLGCGFMILNTLWAASAAPTSVAMDKIKTDPQSALGYATLTNLQEAGIDTSVRYGSSDENLTKRESEIKRLQETWLPTITDPTVRAHYAMWLNFSQRNIAESRKHLPPYLSGMDPKAAAGLAESKTLKGTLPKPPIDSSERQP